MLQKQAWPQTATQKEAMLKELSEGEGESFYTRIQLAAEILDDAEHMDVHFKGDIASACEYLEEKYFRLIADAFALSELVDAYRTLSHATWEDLRFNLKAVVLFYRQKRVEDRRKQQARAEKIDKKKQDPPSPKADGRIETEEAPPDSFADRRSRAIDDLRHYIDRYADVIEVTQLVLLRSVLQEMEAECEAAA